MSNPDPGLRLEYQVPPASDRRKAPLWAWTIVGVYLLLLLGVLALPVWAWSDVTPSDSEVVAVVVSLFLISGMALLITPVRIARGRPMSRKSFLLPMLASGLLFAVLVFGVCIALVELGKAADWVMTPIYIGVGLVWIGWTVVFWIATRSRDPLSLASRFHRWLMAGSIAELLVAVPSHVIVRRRDDCCAGMATGSAICLGAMVMFVSFGPSVMLLYWRRMRQIRRA